MSKPLPYSANLNNHVDREYYGSMDGVSKEEFAELKRLYPNAIAYLESMHYSSDLDKEFDDDGEYLETSPIRNPLHAQLNIWHGDSEPRPLIDIKIKES